MSSWRIFSSLCLLVASIPLSRPNCWEYFDMRSWGGGNLTLDFPLVDADRPNNRLLCTLWKACETFETSKNVSLAHLCSMYYHCFDTDFDKSSCQQQTSQRISFYHLMCLSANVLATSPEEAPPGCRFDPVCDLYSQVTPSVVDQTKTPPTVSTTTPKSTETTTGLTPPPPTTTTTTTAAVTAAAAAAVTPYSSSSSSSSSRLHTTAVISNGQSLKVDGAGGGATLILYLLLMAFVLLVLLALLAFTAAVWFCRRMRGQSQEQNVSERGPETVCLDKSVEGLGCDHF
ncbi:uncharacterized protein LOC103393674 isoform X2 [Cynoglossus semilaevis]|uniref:uncharacterized protein LOC103393674 isoform X2 n=1 Tax=Cynoglossus semilaevis TaxID=244447 RepID=UPI000D62BB8E|nr:uncharacterized protein LOC103393674 isoform X2 [Cynoglossus semilaevis]